MAQAAAEPIPVEDMSSVELIGEQVAVPSSGSETVIQAPGAVAEHPLVQHVADQDDEVQPDVVVLNDQYLLAHNGAYYRAPPGYCGGPRGDGEGPRHRAALSGGSRGCARRRRAAQL